MIEIYKLVVVVVGVVIISCYLSRQHRLRDAGYPTTGQVKTSKDNLEWGGIHDEEALDAPIQVGDIVRMKSGGPLMTVISVGESLITTSWFKVCDERMGTDTFKPAMLYKPEL